MKVMVINGSPRKGNTWKALDWITQALNPAYEVSRFNLYDYSITGCRNCNACQRNGNYCAQPDDSNQLLRQLADSDIVILGTPVYYWGISAQMKLFIDKFYAINAVLASSPKKVVFIACGANPLEDIQYELIEKQFKAITRYLNWDLVKFIPISAYQPNDIDQQADLTQQIQHTGVSL